MKKALFLVLTVFLPLSIFLSACGEKTLEQKESDSKKISVYTTVYPLQYFTERIGASHVQVDTIYPPGSDEHTFEPSQRDMMKLVDADLFFYIGLGLEGFVDKAKKTLQSGNVDLIAAAEDISLETDDAEAHEEHDHADEAAVHEEHNHEHEGESGHEHNHSVDPHVWLDPIHSQELAKAIKDALVEKLPEQKKTFEKNYQALIKELQDLDAELEKTFSEAKQKEIIVAHAAFGYWEKRYGIEQISVSGLSTTNEPSQKKLAEIVTLAEEHDIHYIFFEQNVSSKITETVQEEIGAKSLTLHNLAVLTTKDIDKDETYFTIMDKNMKALKKALNE